MRSSGVRTKIHVAACSIGTESMSAGSVVPQVCQPEKRLVFGLFKVRAAGRLGQNSSYNEPVYVGARKVWFASRTKLSSAAARWITGNRGNRRNFWLEKFGSLREPNF